MCMLPFKSVTSSGGIVDCGNQDAGGTSMNQFSPTFELPTTVDVSGSTVAYGADTNIGPFGYKEYCMNRVPVCTPCNSEVCCDGTNQDGAKTKAITNDPKYPDQSIFGISLGRKYGFCFVPMPSTTVSVTTHLSPPPPSLSLSLSLSLPPLSNPAARSITEFCTSCLDSLSHNL